MTCGEARSRIDEYVEGALAPSEREALEAHLRACARCRLETEGLRALLRDAAALPPRVPPERDLWPAIRDEIRRRKIVPLPRRSAWARRAGLVAAGVALIAISSTLTAILLRDGSRGIADRPSPSEYAVLAGVAAWEGEVVQATHELTEALATNRASLAPATIAVLEQNLRIIDEAIRESRAALERDPGNVALGQMLWSTYRQKLDLLQQAARWSAES